MTASAGTNANPEVSAPIHGHAPPASFVSGHSGSAFGTSAASAAATPAVAHAAATPASHAGSGPARRVPGCARA